MRLLTAFIISILISMPAFAADPTCQDRAEFLSNMSTPPEFTQQIAASHVVADNAKLPPGAVVEVWVGMTPRGPTMVVVYVNPGGLTCLIGLGVYALELAKDS